MQNLISVSKHGTICSYLRYYCESYSSKVVVTFPKKLRVFDTFGGMCVELYVMIKHNNEDVVKVCTL